MAEPQARVPHARVPDVPLVGSRSGISRLLIRVSAGSGVAPTRLAAFDAALFAAGVSGFNLIRLSSVIPANAVVREVTGSNQIRGAIGDVAYCVYADAYASMPGEEAWAGVAWALDPTSGGGLFAEHSACSESVVRRDLRATVAAMSQIRGNRYQLAGEAVSSAVCIDHPVCAVVIATYGTADWSHILNSEG